MKLLQDTYGIDLLSLILILIASVLTLFDLTIFIGAILLIYAIFRAFSKKIYKRKQEYNIFFIYSNKILNKFNKSIPYNLPIYDLNNFSLYFEQLKNKYNEYRKFKITKCPNCNQKLRLPRGKGNIVVTCKKCSTKFDFKT